MRVVWLQHVPFEGLGSIEPWMQARGHQLSCVRLHAGDPLPAPSAFDWLVVMGGPMNIYEHDCYPWLVDEKRCIRAAIDAKLPVLGICLGAQLIADVLGGPVTRNAEKEIGWFPVSLKSTSPDGLFGAFPPQFDAFHWHGDTFALPPGATHAAASAACANQAFVFGGNVVGLQFHLETTPVAARDLATHCADEIVSAPHVQSAAQMLADERRFLNLNRLMDTLLDNMETRSCRV